jgi:hypothetical protein
MGRSIRNAIILAKLETTSGTDAAPSNTANAVLLHATGLDCKINLQMVDRDVLRGGFGSPDKLPYTRRGSITFQIDIAGSGDEGVAPAWDPLLQACAFAAGAVTADTRVTYLPISTAIKTLTLWAYWDGALRKFTYCAGTVKLAFRSGGVPVFEFSFTGLVTDPSAASNPVPTLTSWMRPQAVGPLATTTMLLGCTYAAGALSGGTAYHWSEFNLDLGNSIEDVPLITQEQVDVDDRAPSTDFTLQLSAAQEVALHATAKAGTPLSVGLVHGTAAGNKILVFMTGGVITDIADAPQGKKLLHKISMAHPPVAVANDELVIVAL